MFFFHIFETVMRDWALIGNNGGKKLKPVDYKLTNTLFSGTTSLFCVQAAEGKEDGPF